MVEFVVQGKIFRMEDKYARLSDYLRVIMEENWNIEKDEEGRYILDLDKDAFENYRLYLEGLDFRLNENIMDLFDLMGEHNKYDYPFGYWKGKIMDDLIKDNWNVFSEYIVNMKSYPIKNVLRHDGDIGDYYIVGDAVLYMAGAIKGVHEIHIISDKVPSSILVDNKLIEMDMSNSNNYNKCEFLKNPDIKHEKLNGRTMEEICYSGICDADVVVYSSKDNKIYCTNRGWNALKRREVWFEPDKLSIEYANRLVMLKSQGFKIKLPYRQQISINGLDNNMKPNAIEEVLSANQLSVENTSYDQEKINHILYLNSKGYGFQFTIEISIIDRIIATFNGIIFRFPSYYERDINYKRNKDVDITDVYLLSKYIDKTSLIGDVTMLEYQYQKHIVNREWLTPEWFEFKNYPKLYRDILYLNNTNQDELVFLGMLKDISHIDEQYINAGSLIADGIDKMDVEDKINYVVVFNVNDSNREYYKTYGNDRYDAKTFETSWDRPSRYTLYDSVNTTLRDAVKYSKIDLEQIAYSIKDGGAYCSLLFLYAYYNKVHTITKETKLNTIHRLCGAYYNNIDYFVPSNIEHEEEVYPDNITDALIQLAMYDGKRNFISKNVEIDDSAVQEIQQALELVPKDLRNKARRRGHEYLRTGSEIYLMPYYTGMGLKFKSHVEYGPSTLLLENSNKIYVYPLDHYGTIGSGEHELHEL